MAQKRMFSLSVVDTDRFVEMPVSAQALYFHLGMHGDDDGFVASPRKIARAVGCNLDDLRVLAQKNFIIPFDSGVIVIVDWNSNNTLKNDRYKPTVYQDEKARLSEGPDGNYLLQNSLPDGTSTEPVWNQSGSSFVPQHNRTEHNLTEHSITERERGASREAALADKPPRARFVPPDEAELIAFFREAGSDKAEAEAFRDYYEANGWKVGKNRMKDWKAAARNWIRRSGQYNRGSSTPSAPTAWEALDKAAERIECGDFTFMEV